MLSEAVSFFTAGETGLDHGCPGPGSEGHMIINISPFFTMSSTRA
jgi:hypothetical protein